MAFRSSSTSGDWQLSATCPIAVPSGSATNDIAIAGLVRWNDGSGLPAIVQPSGFTQIGTAVIQGPYEYTFWQKRLSGADSGTYDFSWGGAGKWNAGRALLLTGRITTGDPIEASDSGSGTSQAVGSRSVTTVTQPDLVWGVALDGATVSAYPTSFTSAANSDSSGAFAYRVPGTTGVHTASGASLSVSEDWQVFLIAVKPEPTGGVNATLSATLPALTGAFTVTSQAAATLDAQLPALMASLAGTVEVDAALAATLPNLTAAFAAGAGVLVNLDFIALAPVLAHGTVTVEMVERTAGAPAMTARTALAPAMADRTAGDPALGHGDTTATLGHGDTTATLGHGQAGEPTT